MTISDSATEDQVRQPCPFCGDRDGFDWEDVHNGESLQEILICSRGECWDKLIAVRMFTFQMSNFARRMELHRRVNEYVGYIGRVIDSHAGPGTIDAETSLYDLMVLALNRGDVFASADAWRS